MGDGGEGWRQHAKTAGKAVIKRREELGYKTRAQLADDVDLHVKTLGEIERGVRPSYGEATYATIDRVLKWEAGHFRSLLTGEINTPTAEAELSTLAGLHAWLHRMEPAVLGALLHRSNLDFEAKWAMVNAEREHAVEQLRDNWQRLAEEIRAAGGTVDPDTWPSWLEAPALVDEIRKKQGDG